MIPSEFGAVNFSIISEWCLGSFSLMNAMDVLQCWIIDAGIFTFMILPYFLPSLLKSSWKSVGSASYCSNVFTLLVHYDWLPQYLGRRCLWRRTSWTLLSYIRWCTPYDLLFVLSKKKWNWFYFIWFSFFLFDFNFLLLCSFYLFAVQHVLLFLFFSLFTPLFNYLFYFCCSLLLGTDFICCFWWLCFLF